MSGLRKRNPRAEADGDVDMVPIMNMFLVLVPFLLMSASFLHIRAINTSVPVLGSASTEHSVEKDVKAIVVVELKAAAISLSLNADALEQEEVLGWSREFVKKGDSPFPFSMLASHLEEIKSAYPASDTLVIVPHGDVLYDTIIQTMDVARYGQTDTKLFPNVVISGKIE
jgi:biopolymer transport protein ExbD